MTSILISCSRLQFQRALKKKNRETAREPSPQMLRGLKHFVLCVVCLSSFLFLFLSVCGQGGALLVPDSISAGVSCFCPCPRVPAWLKMHGDGNAKPFLNTCTCEKKEERREKGLWRNKFASEASFLTNSLQESPHYNPTKISVCWRYPRDTWEYYPVFESFIVKKLGKMR